MGPPNTAGNSHVQFVEHFRSVSSTGTVSGRVGSKKISPKIKQKPPKTLTAKWFFKYVKVHVFIAIL
jgi:hypothetical protein